MDFNPCMKHLLVRKTVRAFAENEIKPHVSQLDKNPNATMMKMADVAIVADANQVCSGIIRAVKEKIRD